MGLFSQIFKFFESHNYCFLRRTMRLQAITSRKNVDEIAQNHIGLFVGFCV